MAEGLALFKGVEAAEIASAGTEASRVHPMAIKVMAEIGIDISDFKSKTLNSLSSLDYDIVVTLCSQAAESCPVLPGHPAVVHWNLSDPDGIEGDDKAVLDGFRQTRDKIKQLVDDFFDYGYMSSLAKTKSSADIILSNISDGVIAHDLNRRIFYFNKSAEEITGYSCEEVLNRDCHDVFPGNFCGANCKFCEDVASLDDVCKQDIQISIKNGETKNVSMIFRKLTGDNEEDIGVLVSFRDITKERQFARRAKEINSFAGIIGRDHKMLELYDLVSELADSNVPVLIQGESGTGKELVAAAIHNEGRRANFLFVPVNCGALPETLLESELFGHEKGAFTGAIRDKKGRFELADDGTVFLDEIGDISPAMQIRLLRVIQEGTFERVGSEKTIRVNVRIISATNKDLTKEIEDGRFREDLYYRLAVVPIWLPSLRERRNDIPLLINHVLESELKSLGKTGITVFNEAPDIMISYALPGNVREL
ncbi:sigma 54-interacting transcriptional regulator [PVC group bacterium]|nr:sigma 54-interacting transcriptional regulator [PVC group bacterium]